MIESVALTARLLHHLRVVTRSGNTERLRIDGAEHIDINKAVVKRRDQGVSHRMGQPHQITVVTWSIDYNNAVCMRQCINHIGKSLASHHLIFRGQIIDLFIETKMIGESEVTNHVLGPRAPVFYIMRERLLPRIEIDGGYALA